MKVARKLSVVALRQSIQKLAASLERGGPPVLLTFRGREVAAIVSLRDFRERFGLQAAEAERQRVVEDILAHARKSPVGVDEVLDQVRAR